MANIHDVARQAGVSAATVSRVLNGFAYVNSDVRARVYATMEELRYQPSRAARSLRANHSTIIGLLIADIQNPFFLEVIQGVEDVAHRNGYSLILCNSDENPRKEQHYLEVLCAERVAGAIIVPTRERQHNNLQCFQERNIPLVAVDRLIKDSAIDAVLVDNIRGASEAVAHLIANGYRRIGVITGPLVTTTGRERLQGYRQALREAGIPHDPQIERHGPYKKEHGRLLANELLALDNPIDALFVGNNMMTVGALEALHLHNIRVPDDLALVGYDETYWTGIGAVSLTTVSQPNYDLGSTAAQRLFHRLQNPAEARQEIILSPSLCIRSSSYPPGKSPAPLPAIMPGYS